MKKVSVIPSCPGDLRRGWRAAPGCHGKGENRAHEADQEDAEPDEPLQNTVSRVQLKVNHQLYIYRSGGFVLYQSQVPLG